MVYLPENQWSYAILGKEKVSSKTVALEGEQSASA
jgi:hypothetical protein